MLKELGKLSLAVSAVRMLDDALPVQTLAVFLEIARNDGISINELCDKVGLASSSASRNVAALSDWHWLNKPGLGLVETLPDPKDLRRKTVRLTAKGRQLKEQMAAMIGEGQT
jgi:DNA-binding MarR family transcriptional regulator